MIKMVPSMAEILPERTINLSHNSPAEAKVPLRGML
jgi:hypothetical protein